MTLWGTGPTRRLALLLLALPLLFQHAAASSSYLYASNCPTRAANTLYIGGLSTQGTYSYIAGLLNATITKLNNDLSASTGFVSGRPASGTFQ